MIAQLDEESMDVVLHGDPAADRDRSGGSDRDRSGGSSSQDNIRRSRGVIGCWLIMMPRIDHKREYAAIEARKLAADVADVGILQTWDFMLKRSNGTVCFLHPEQTDIKVAFYEGVPPDSLTILERSLGANGPHYFQNAIRKGVSKSLRFARQRTPLNDAASLHSC